MKRSVTLTILTVLLASVPAWAAPPFGSFGGQVGGGNAGANLMPLTGWALDDNGVNAVDILVDGVVTTYDRPFSPTDHEAISVDIPIFGVIRARRMTAAHEQDIEGGKLIRVKP